MSNVLLNKQKTEELSLEQSKSVSEEKSLSLQESMQIKDVAQADQDMISSGFKVKSMADNVDELEGTVPAGPKHIGMARKFTVAREGDSDKMLAIRGALKDYYDSEKTEADVVKLQKVIDACNSYTRFKFLKWGRGKERLDEVKALRAEAEAEMAKVNTLITRDFESEEYDVKNEQRRNASLPRRLTACAGAVLGTTLGNIFKLVTLQPLWRKQITWKPGAYYNRTLGILDQTLGRVTYVDKYDENMNVIGVEKVRMKITNTSLKDKEKSETLAAEERMIQQDLEDLKTLEEGGELIDEEAYLDEQEQIEKTEYNEAVRVKALENSQMDQTFSAMQIDERDEEYKEEELQAKLAEFEAFDLKSISFSSNAEMLNGFKASMAKFAEIRATQSLLMRGLMRGLKLDDKRLVKLRAKFNCAFEMQQYLATLNNMAVQGKLDFTKPEDEIREKVGESVFGQKKGSFMEKRMIARPGDVDGFLAECEKDLEKEYKERKTNIKKMYSITEKGTDSASMPSDLLEKKMDAYETNAIIYDYMHYRTSVFLTNGGWAAINAERKENGKKEYPTPSRWHNNFLYGKSYEEQKRLTRLVMGPDSDEEEELKQEIIKNDTAEITDEKQKEEYARKQVEASKAKERLEYYKVAIRDMKSMDPSEFDARDLSKLYDNYDRKLIVLSLYTNARDYTSGVMDCLKIIKEAEVAKIKKTDPDYQYDPKERLQLPEDYLKEFGYGNLDDFTKDMHVSMEIGNAYQTKFDAIAQVKLNKFTPYYSIEEFTSQTSEKKAKLDKNVDAYKQKLYDDTVKKLDDVDDIPPIDQFDFEFSDEYTYLFYLKDQIDMITLPIKTRQVTEKDQEEGKLQQSLTRDVDLSVIREEEETAYWRESIKLGSKGREDVRKAESAKAKEYVKRKDEMIHSRDDQVNAKISKSETRHRFIAGYVGPLSVLLNDTKEKTDERIDALNIKVAEATAEQKQRMAKELESAFKTIMDFDLKELNFDDFGDIVGGAYDKVAAMTSLCFEFNELFNDYAKLMADPNSGTLLTKEEYAEVKAKKDYLQSLNALFAVLPENMANEDLNVKYDAAKVMGLTEAELRALIEKEKEKGNKDMEIALNFAAIPGMQLESVHGVTRGMDMKEKYRRMRDELGAPKEDMTESIRKKLQDR